MWLGTTWEKIEEKFLLGSGTDYPLGSTGGNSTITLTEANMPRHRHRVDSFTLTTQPHVHRIGYSNSNGNDTSPSSYGSGWTVQYNRNTESGGGENTGTASPYTNYVGSGTAFNNMPPYLVVNIWKRLS